MASYIGSEPDRHSLTCQHWSGCDRLADCIHHSIPLSDGGTDEPSNRVPLCFFHHHEVHARREDWKRWGKNGGMATAKNPVNFMHNLRSFRIMRQESLDLWLEWLDYYRSDKQGQRPMTLAEWRCR